MLCCTSQGVRDTPAPLRGGVHEIDAACSCTVVIVFRKLVVVGLVVGLGSCGLGCGSGTRYSGIPEAKVNESNGADAKLGSHLGTRGIDVGMVGLISPATCDLPDAPAEKLYYRAVGPSKEQTDFKWSESDEWTRVGATVAPFDLCRQEWLDRILPIHPTTTTMVRTTTTRTTTTLDPVVAERCRRAMKEVKRVLYTSDNDVFENAFRVTLRVCGNQRTWLRMAKAEGGGISGMLVAACILNDHMGVCGG